MQEPDAFVGNRWDLVPNFCDGSAISSAPIYTLKNMYLMVDAWRSPFGSRELLYCAAVHIHRKTATMMGKMVVLPPLSPSQLAVGKPKISAGGTATGQ